MTTNLTEPRQSFRRITVYELIDLTLLDKLINSKLLKETFNNKIPAFLKTKRTTAKIQGVI
jgi:hypothetical protein